MSSTSYQNAITRLEKEVMDIDKKISELDKKILDSESKILREEKKMNQRMSSSSLQSIARNIGREKQNINHYKTDRNTLSQKRLQKNKDISRNKESLQRALKSEDQARKRREQIQIQSQRSTSFLDTQFSNGKPLRELANYTQQIQQEPIQPIHTQNNEIIYDVFISHASEDKEDFVKPLVEALKNSDINAWYDNDEIGWGDSIPSSINRGLAKSKYAIVVLSPFFMNKYWTTTELDTIMSMESVNAQKLLPIFHNISYEEIALQKPIVAGRLGLNSNQGIDCIVEQMRKKLSK